MDHIDDYLQKLDELYDMSNNGALECLSHSDRKDLERLLVQAREIAHQCMTTLEPGGDPSHPMGRTPFAAAKLMFIIDQCEAVVENGKINEQDSAQECFQGDEYLYPVVSTSAVRSIMKMRLHRRARRSPCMSVNYDQPTVVEILFLRNSFGARRIWEAFLPESRPSRAYPSPLPAVQTKKQRLVDLARYYRTHPLQVWKLPVALTKIFMPARLKRIIRTLYDRIRGKAHFFLVRR